MVGLRVKLSDANRTLTCLTSALRRAAGCSQRSPVDLWRVSFAKNWSKDADGRHRQERCLVALQDTTAVRLERRSVRRSAALKSWKQTRSWRLVNPCLANSSRCQTPKPFLSPKPKAFTEKISDDRHEDERQHQNCRHPHPQVYAQIGKVM